MDRNPNRRKSATTPIQVQVRTQRLSSHLISD
jgi:hypothetical protein